MVASYNGWPASTDPAKIDIDKGFAAAGRRFPGGVKRGPVSVVFRYLIEQFDRRVEPVDLYDPGDEWGYVYRTNRNASNLSCHSSGTAVDINATRHPNGRRGTFTSLQVKAIRSILAELDGVIRWGGDFSGTPDEMHFEVCGDATAVAKVAGKLLTAGTDAPAPTPVPIEEDDDMPLPKATLVKVKGRPEVWLAGLTVAPRQVERYADLEYHLARLAGVELVAPDKLYPAAATDDVPDADGARRRVLIVADGSLFGIG